MCIRDSSLDFNSAGQMLPDDNAEPENAMISCSFFGRGDGFAVFANKKIQLTKNTERLFDNLQRKLKGKADVG